MFPEEIHKRCKQHRTVNLITEKLNLYTLQETFSDASKMSHHRQKVSMLFAVARLYRQSCQQLKSN